MEGLFRGADDYIVKPFGTKEWLARVRAHLRREERRKECYSEIALSILSRALRSGLFCKVLRFPERELVAAFT